MNPKTCNPFFRDLQPFWRLCQHGPFTAHDCAASRNDEGNGIQMTAQAPGPREGERALTGDSRDDIERASRTPTGRLQRDGLVFSFLRVRAHQVRRQLDSAAELNDVDLFHLSAEERNTVLATFLTTPAPACLRDAMQRAGANLADTPWLQTGPAFPT